MLWDRLQYRTDQPVYESEPDGHGHTKGSPPYASVFFVLKAMDETVEFQIEAITDALEAMVKTVLQYKGERVDARFLDTVFRRDIQTGLAF